MVKKMLSAGMTKNGTSKVGPKGLEKVMSPRTICSKLPLDVWVPDGSLKSIPAA